jgi:hypothetical protein
MAVPEVISVERWNDFDALCRSGRFRSWAFRGQSDSRWGLETTLGRYLKRFGVHRNLWRLQEERIVRIFKRKAHLMLQHVPPDEDDLQWLAIMQHHGAPTRLLDLTWSPYVAAFFALEQASAEAAVWALNPAWVNYEVRAPSGAGPVRAIELGPWIQGHFQRYFLPGAVPFAVIGEPLVMNQRLISQLATFVVPSVLETPVDQVLGRYAGAERAVAKIVLPVAKIRDEAMRALFNMNITNASLFPGLDGLARSLYYELEFHWAFDPKTDEEYPGFEGTSRRIVGTSLKAASEQYGIEAAGAGGRESESDQSESAQSAAQDHGAG